jgi:hypothetical protein
MSWIYSLLLKTQVEYDHNKTAPVPKYHTYNYWGCVGKATYILHISTDRAMGSTSCSGSHSLEQGAKSTPGWLGLRASHAIFSLH